MQNVEKTIKTISDRRKKQLLNELFYHDQQVCLIHINMFDDSFDLLLVVESAEMKSQLENLFDFEKSLEIFKIEHSNWFEVKDDDEDEEKDD